MLFGVGAESLEVELIDWEALPMDEIVFLMVYWMLTHEREVQHEGYEGAVQAAV